MSESAAEGEFRVTDRRRRGEESEPRSAPTVEATEAGSVPPVEAAPSATSGKPAPGPLTPSAVGSGETPPADQGERSLEGLFAMLASSAIVALGQAADPMTGKVRDRDPAAAADAIDLLALLREKTEGHRTSRETQLLDELIYDLQLRYVAAMRPSL